MNDKLHIFSAYTIGVWSKLGQLTSENHAAYATAIGAEYQCRAIAGYRGMANWVKIDTLWDWISRKDQAWACWIDADACFTSRRSIHDLIGQAGQDADLIIGCDENDENTGVFILKATDEARQLLHAIGRLKDKYLYHPWAEQAALHEILKVEPNICRISRVEKRALQGYAEGVAGPHGGDWTPDSLTIHRPGGSVLDKLMALTPHLETFSGSLGDESFTIQVEKSLLDRAIAEANPLPFVLAEPAHAVNQ